MQTVVYRISLSKNNVRLRFRLFVGLAMIVLAVTFVATFGVRVLAGDKFDSFDLLIFIVGLAAMTQVMAHVYAIRPSGNFMTLDESGLTYGPRHWRWDELSAFKLQGRWMGRHIVFAVPGQANWLTRFDGAWLGLPEGPLVRIQNIYDAPLDEIAAKLNEYRERALGGGADIAGPQAPAPA